MFTASNALSLLRAPLAFLFLIDRIDVRICVLCTAMLTDIIDGYLARLYKTETRVGAVLDPVMDKFFVFFVVSCLLIEAKLNTFEAVAMISRDIALVIFGLYLLWQNRFKVYNFRAIIWGKVTTALQFFVIFFSILQVNITIVPFLLFIFFSCFALVELFLTLKTNIEKV